MSSHREAPEISQDPVCDNTDTYAFISPDKPDTVTILTNYIPLEAAAAGPNFYEFGDDVLYSIHICNSGSGLPDITYEFSFNTQVSNPKTFLYNTGAITSLDDPSWNRRQFYSVTKVTGSERTAPIIEQTAVAASAASKSKTKGKHDRHKHHKAKPKGTSTVLATNLACPPCNIGPHSTPSYAPLAQAAVHSLPGGITVFAGQRNDGFYADLGAIFDLADLRPFQSLHVASMAPATAVDTLKSGINVHTIALQIPITELTQGGVKPTDPTAARSTIGIWGAASRRKMRIRGDQNQAGAESGPWVQVSRLGNPLFNELLVGQGSKDQWNRSAPYGDKGFANGVSNPELQTLIPELYPGVFPALAKLAASGARRTDLEAIFLTGIPAGIVSGFQNYTGAIQADMLRLNLAVAPSSSPNVLGVIAGDNAGFPNGRRVSDDIVTIIIRALAGVTYALVNKSFKPDAASSLVTQGVATPTTAAAGSGRFIPYFPYLGLPDDGFSTPPNPTPPATVTAPTVVAPPSLKLPLTR